MSKLKKLGIVILSASLVTLSNPDLEALTYVTDTGGYAYDESRAVANLAPAIALATVAIVGIIAIAVQNSHGSSSSSSSSSYGHYDYCYTSGSSYH